MLEREVCLAVLSQLRFRVEFLFVVFVPLGIGTVYSLG